MTSITAVFTDIYRNNVWGSSESVSGNGSSLFQTRRLRRWLPETMRRFGVKSILDLPCGDFNWMKKINLGNTSYIGGDVVEEIIAEDRKNYGSSKKKFRVMNIISDKLPKADLLICRDCFVHFSYKDIETSLKNVRRSGIKYLLLTTFRNYSPNKDIKTGDWRALNFEIEPFNFQKPIAKLTEGCTEQNGKYPDKSMALWEVASLPELNI